MLVIHHHSNPKYIRIDLNSHYDEDIVAWFNVGCCFHGGAEPASTGAIWAPEFAVESSEPGV